MPKEASEFQKVVIFGVLGTKVSPHSICDAIDFIWLALRYTNVAHTFGLTVNIIQSFIITLETYLANAQYLLYRWIFRQMTRPIC